MISLVSREVNRKNWSFERCLVLSRVTVSDGDVV